MDRNKIEGYIQTGTGAAAGYYAYKYGNRYIYKGNHKLLSLIKDNPAPETLDRIKNAGYQFFNNTPEFKNHRMEILDISQIDYNMFLHEKIANGIKRLADKRIKTSNPIIKWYLKRKIDRKIKIIKYNQQRVLEGENAYFTGNRQVVINMKKFPQALFHELGHAQDSIHAKPLCYLRGNKLIKALPLFILTTSLLTTPKQNETKDKNKFQKAAYKTGSFIKNNCGKLMALTLAPMVIEEGVASLRGQINAKRYLNNADLKTITKSHIHSFASYSVFAMTAGVAMFMANKIRDFIAETDIHTLSTKIHSTIRKTHQKIHN